MLDVGQFAGRDCYFIDFGWPISANVAKDRQGRYVRLWREWRDTICDQIWKSLGCTGRRGAMPPATLIGRVGVWWEVWMPDDRRRRDVDNFTGKHCLDALVWAKLIEDDCKVWQEHRYRRGTWRTGRVLAAVAEV
jgi:hypothetical protein